MSNNETCNNTSACSPSNKIINTVALSGTLCPHKHELLIESRTLPIQYNPPGVRPCTKTPPFPLISLWTLSDFGLETVNHVNYNAMQNVSGRLTLTITGTYCCNFDVLPVCLSVCLLSRDTLRRLFKTMKILWDNSWMHLFTGTVFH